MSVTLNGKYWTKTNLQDELDLSPGQLNFVLKKIKLQPEKVGQTLLFDQDQYILIAQERTKIRRSVL